MRIDKNKISARIDVLLTYLQNNSTAHIIDETETNIIFACIVNSNINKLELGERFRASKCRVYIKNGLFKLTIPKLN